MTGAHKFFRLYAPVICDPPPPPPPELRGMSRTLTLCLQLPHSNHHTAGAASWQNHDSSPPQSVFKLHSNVCLGLSNPYISSALWRQRKSKKTAYYIAILLRGLGEAVVTNDRCIIYSLWCTSHEHLVLSHPDNIHWYVVQPISKHIPTPSLVSLSDLSIIFYWMGLFFTWITLDGWALWLFYLITKSCPELRFGMHVLHCLESTNQYLE